MFSSIIITTNSGLNKPWLTKCNLLFFRHISTNKFQFKRAQIDGSLSSYNQHGARVSERENSQQKRSPVVVLLGWNGSKDKHLAKYSDIFTQKNYATVRVTANPFNTFFRSGTKVKQIAHNILNILSDMECEDRPIFLYAFSNGGGAVFFHVMEALTKPESKFCGKFKVAGSVFDSCPINADIKSVKIVQESVTDPVRNPIVKGLLWYSLGIFIPFVVYMNPTVKRYMESMKTSTLLCNQLVLYSKADRFAPYLDIEEYITARRKQGVHVVAQRWEDSAHVNHYREHKEEYLNVLNSFVDECLENKSNT